MCPSILFRWVVRVGPGGRESERVSPFRFPSEISLLTDKSALREERTAEQEGRPLTCLLNDVWVWFEMAQ